MAIKPLVKPRFATSDLSNGPLGGPNVQEPSELKKNSGWDSGEKPPREYFNWLHRLTYQWIDWLDEVASDALLKSNNLSDLSNTTTARTNLGLGTAAVTNTGTSAGNVPTITDADGRYARRSNNLSDLTSASTARTNLGIGTLAVQNASAVTVGDFSATGLATVRNKNNAAQRAGWHPTQIIASASRDFNLTDIGNTVIVTTSAITLTITNISDSGDMIQVVNTTSGNITLTSSGTALRWYSGGTEATGSRTIAQKSAVTLYKLDGINWLLWGNGIS